MGIAQNASEEFFQELTYGAYYQLVSPMIKEYIDSKFPEEKDEKGRVKPNLMREAVESSINVLVMGILMMVIRHQDAFFDKIFSLAGNAKDAIRKRGLDAIEAVKNRVSGKKGFKASKRFAVLGSKADPAVTQALHNIDVNLQKSAIATARHSSVASVSAYSPSAQIMDTAVQKQNLKDRKNADLANVTVGMANFKLWSGSFQDGDKQMLKTLGSTVGTDGKYKIMPLDTDSLNNFSTFAYCTDSAGVKVGLSKVLTGIYNTMNAPKRVA